MKLWGLKSNLYILKKKGLWKKMNQMLTQSLQQQLDLKVNHQGLKGKTEDIHENGREYVRIIETPYWNLMLDRWVLIIEERPTWHKLILAQKVIRGEVWISGF